MFGVPASALLLGAANPQALISSLSEPNHSVLQWVVDLCTLVASREDVNSMSGTALAVALGACLGDQAPGGRAGQFLAVAIQQRLRKLAHAEARAAGEGVYTDDDLESL